jgi:3-methyl-2-oxobutanoate hydroxymethyltransferase
MMVKLEGGKGQIAVVEHLAAHDIPVCAHLGLKPQSVHKIGGFKVQGRQAEVARKMLDDAQALERAGADVILLECVPNEVGKSITKAVNAPVIGIGAGPAVDGQILVLYDVLGITQGRMPRFVKNFLDGQPSVIEGLRHYVRAVKERTYPAREHCFS